jgi:hypothetical protein
MSIASQQRTGWTAALGIPLLFAAIIALQTRMDLRSGAGAQDDELLVASPAAIKKLSLGYDALLGDIYWTRAVQYYGSRAGIPGKNFDQLWPLLDIATTLDPKLLIAYRFGAIFLSQPGTAGPGRTDLAVKLVERGIAANPNEWTLYSDLGFIQYWQLKNYPSAAKTYLHGSKVTNAPVWLGMMAARIEQREGLKAEEDEQQLDALVDQYQRRFNRAAASVRVLLDAGLIAGMPVDPAGYAYRLGPDGRAELDPQSPIVIPEAPLTPPGASK